MWATIIALVLLCGLYYRYSTKDFGIFHKMGVKGPTPWPVVGNIHELLKKGFVESYKQWYEKHGRVFGIHEGLNPVLVVGDLNLIKEIMVKEFHNFTNRPDFGLFRIEGPPITELLNLMKDDEWRHTRSILVPAFTSSKVRKMSAQILKAAESTVKALEPRSEDRKPVEIKAYTSAYTMDVISTTAFGLNVDSQNNPDDPFVRYAKKLFTINFTNPVFIAMFLCPFVLPVLRWLGFRLAPKDTTEFFKQIVLEAITRRRLNDTEHSDFLQLMMKSQCQPESCEGNHVQSEQSRTKHDHRSVIGAKRGLTDSQIVASSIVFFGAGFDTSAATLAHALYHLALNPRHMDRLIREIDEHFPEGVTPDYESLERLPFLRMVIYETLRINPPIGRAERVCSRDTTIGHLRIPAGMVISIPIYMIHHDPELWQDPEIFDPERFNPTNHASHHPLQWMPFGHGPRGCIGVKLAMFEIKMLLVLLLQKYRFVPNTKTEPLTFGSTLVLSQAVNGVWLTVENRHSKQRPSVDKSYL